MKNVLVLSASGLIARWLSQALAQRSDTVMTLFLRNPKKLSGMEPANSKLVIGSALDRKLLEQAMSGQDIVYANLTGDDIDAQARSVVTAMRAAGIKRLVFVLSLGIYDEVPGKFGEWNNATIGEDLKPFARAAEVIEDSGLDYTIVRPAWLTDEDEDEVDYELTGRHELFKGTVVSRRSVADLIAKIVESPQLHNGESLGVNKPNTGVDKPYFM